MSIQIRPEIVLVLGAHARALAFLEAGGRFHCVSERAALAPGQLPAAVLALPTPANMDDIVNLRYERAFDDIAFIALADPQPVHAAGTPTIVFDDWFDIETTEAGELCARLAGVINATAARARASRRLAMLQQLDNAFRESSAPAAVTREAARLLGQALGVNRCAYADVEDDQDTFNLIGDYNDGVDSIVGRYRFAEFGAECLRLMRAGLPYVVEDSETDARTLEVLASYRATAIRAVVCVPLLRNGRFVAAMAVHQNEARIWHMDEVKLLLTVADRCWESIQRTRIERDMVAQDARYQALVETMSAVVWITAEDGSAHSDNPSWSAFTGQDFAHYQGFGWVQAIHPDDRDRILATWKVAVAARSAYADTYRLRRHDGQYRSMMVRGVLVDNLKGGVEWVGNCLDVTEIRLAEQRLQDASRRLQFTLESAQIADWDLDLERQECTRSERHDEIFGYRHPLPRWNVEVFFEHVHPADLEQVRDDFERAMSTRGQWHFECRIVWPDTSVHWVLGSGYHYREPGSARQRMLGIVYDVTARKNSELALLEADRRKDEFLAMLAHELRNPLAPIAAAAELLKVYLNDPVKMAQASAVIARQVKHMTSLIEDLLDVSRVTRGLVKIDKRPCDMNKVIAVAVEQTRPMLETHRHELSVTLAKEAPALMGDEARLVQVVANLLDNAAKYTPPGGKIVVRVDADDRNVACSVSDNGLGMSREFIAHAFDLFTQADVGLARSGGGLGLGLALVKSLVSMHDGTVVAHSEGIGLGSQFAISLPRCQVLAPEAPIEQAERAAASLRIVLVDDNVDAANLLAQLLTALGHAVVVFHHPAQLLEYQDSAMADVFLLDIGLPGIDGKTLARHLRSRHPHARLFAISGYEASIYKGDEKRLFDAHFVKPVDFAQLSAALARCRRGKALPLAQ